MDIRQETRQPDVDPGAVMPAAKQSKKRVITAARKEQNKLAQRAYRRRQKELKKVRERSALPVPRRLEPRQDRIEVLRVQNPPGELQCGGEDENSHPDTNTSYSSSSNFESPPGSDPLNEGSTEQSSCVSDNEAINVSLTSIAETLLDDPDAHPPELITIALRLRGSLEENSTTVFRACLSNAIRIGLDLRELMFCEQPCMSPFYRPVSQMKDTTAALVAASSYDSLPPSLRPTLAQILIPHHASLDLIPLPRLRERAILMCAALPHVFSLWEMKLDVYTRNALVCQGRDSPRESVSQPWDMRYWRAAPWFVSKWKMVVDADEIKTSLAVPGIPGIWM